MTRKVMIAIVFLFLMVALATELAAQSSAPDWSTASHRILPFIVGNGWGTSLTTVNNSGDIQTKFVWKSLAGAEADLTAWSTDGRFSGTNPVMKLGMGPRTTDKMELTYHELLFGWIDHSILPTTGGEPSTTASVTIRHLGDDGKAIGEAPFSEVIPAKVFSFPVDGLGGAQTSLLLVNPNGAGVKAKITMRNCDGGDLGTHEVSPSPFGGIAGMLSAALGYCGIGSVDVIADGEIVVFAFKLNADGRFFNIPPAGRPQQ